MTKSLTILDRVLRGACAVALLVACNNDNPPATDGGTGGDDGGLGNDAAVTDTGGSTTDTGPDTGPDAGWETAPVFRHTVGIGNDQLARMALALMGAPEAGATAGTSCGECHAITRQNIRHFWDLSNTAWMTCLSDLNVETQAAAMSVVTCLQDGSGNYTTANLGVFATGATFDWFQFVFRRAFGAGWETEYDRFTMRVQQSPAPRTALTQAEFDLLTEWFLRGTPSVETVLPSLDGPGECTSYVDASVAGIVAEGALSGWGARNMEAGILMHDCAGATSPEECLSSYPSVTTTTYGAMWETPGTHQRILFDVPYHSSYWTRASADGRFVAHGGGTSTGASIIDLERGVVIGADGAYDPGFFPDNSGFMFQGTSAGPSVCNQSILLAGMPTHVTFSEPGCTHPSAIGLYQHVGASLDGGDYWAVNSRWSGDPGNATVDPPVYADAAGTVTLIRMTNTGTGFVQAGTRSMAAPWEGNAVVSPTMRLMVTQLADASGNALGYVLHRIDIGRDSLGNIISTTIPEVGRYCVPGGKAAFSLDDRWLVTHHRATADDAVDLGFTGPTDPAFAPYMGVSNVYLIDLATGVETRVTNMQPGQRALFPHFRSDGWLYFLVRTGSLPEYVVASDAGLVLR